MILRPRVIVLDEPTSALDRSVQKQIVTLLLDLQQKHDLSYFFISHDLAVVRAVADYILVMKDGEVVEEGSTEAVFDAPQTGIHAKSDGGRAFHQAIPGRSGNRLSEGQPQLSPTQRRSGGPACLPSSWHSSIVQNSQPPGVSPEAASTTSRWAGIWGV